MGKTKKTKPSEVRSEKGKKTTGYKASCPSCGWSSSSSTKEEADELVQGHWNACHAQPDDDLPFEASDAPASEPPNPDEPHELEEDEAVEPEALPVRKVEISTLIPGATVLERMERTLLVSLTEAELTAKRAEVYTAADTIEATNAQIAELKKTVKSVAEHQSVLIKLIRNGQENRSVKCEKVLEGRMVSVYRADLRERIESRPAMGHELQLTLTE